MSDVNPLKQASALEKLADRVPIDVAGSVLVLVVFLWVSPSILERMHNDAQVYCYIILLGMIIAVMGGSVLLYSFGKYRERDRKSWSKTLKELATVDDKDAASRTRSLIEEATANMEERHND